VPWRLRSTYRPCTHCDYSSEGQKATSSAAVGPQCPARERSRREAPIAEDLRPGRTLNFFAAFSTTSDKRKNFFAAFSTTSDKRKVLQMADDFSYNVRGFKATWRDLVEFSGLLDHTVMTTSSHHHIRHRSELWSDAKKIDFLIDMFSKAGEAWVLAAMMRPGAEHITAVVAQPEICHLVPILADNPLAYCPALISL